MQPQSRVVTIDRGNAPRDRVDQKHFVKLSKLQATEWTIQQKLQREIEETAARIQAGAEVEDGDLYFDLELRMVRSRKKSK